MKEKIPSTLITLCSIFFLTGCVTRSYYVSPMYGSSSSYRTMPLQRDSIKSALYINSAFTIGGANQGLRDNVYSLQSNIYRAHQFSAFKAWYGAGFTLGNYNVNSIDFIRDYDYDGIDTAAINRMAGNKFFGSTNLNAGFTIVLPLGKAGEWRLLSVTGSLQNEFGDYLHFRNNLKNDSIKTSGFARSAVLATVGFSNEIVFRTRTGAFSIHSQYTLLAGKDYKDIYHLTTPDYSTERYGYFSHTYALTVNNVTGYIQSNIGQRMFNFQTGFNYLFASRSKKAKSNTE